MLTVEAIEENLFLQIQEDDISLTMQIADSAPSGVVVSGAPGNVLQTNPDGLYVGAVQYVQTIDDLAQIKPDSLKDGQSAQVVSTGRAGLFRWQSGDLSAEVSADPLRGIYVPADGDDGSGGAWVRVYDTMHDSFFGVAGDWDDATQSGTDDTVSLQAAIDYARSAGSMLHSRPGSMIRVTGQIRTNDPSVYSRSQWEGNGATIILDSATAHLSVRGGAQTQTLSGITVRPSDEYNLQNHGLDLEAPPAIHILNARHNLAAVEVREHRGIGVHIQSTAPNTNSSRHQISAEGCGRGVYISGTNDNLSVIKSDIRAHSNATEGVRVEDDTAMRQWVAQWYAELNWSSGGATTDAAVYIGGGSGSDLWIYAEQVGGPGEIFVHPEKAVVRVFSARASRDYIGGLSSAHGVRGEYQNLSGIIVPDTERRRATLPGYFAHGPRENVAGEYIRVPFRFAYSGEPIAYLRAEQRGLWLDSASNPFPLGVCETHHQLGVNRLYNGEIMLSGSVSEMGAVVSAPFNPLTATVLGRLRVVGGTGSTSTGQGRFIRDVAFHVLADGAIQFSDPQVAVDPASNVPTATLSYQDGALFLTAAYNPSYWGALYRVRYSVDLIASVWDV